MEKSEYLKSRDFVYNEQENKWIHEKSGVFVNDAYVKATKLHTLIVLTEYNLSPYEFSKINVTGTLR